MNKKKLEKRLRNKKFKEWALAVKTRDNFRCGICNSDKNLDSAHIFPREIHRFRFDIHNGITLCKKHHKFSIDISSHKNPFVFFLWFSQNRKEQFEYLKNINIFMNFVEEKKL